ncbi:armadillo repeat-containing protein 5 isoform X2 [Phalacrocorax aristotelis]|uniref:armadillo repeat-containing protein 5 isoform X2 n=1 Tax=Phalacrocorax aristotelis TaxID=126867 RepID=UPI003F4C0DD4
MADSWGEHPALGPRQLRPEVSRRSGANRGRCDICCKRATSPLPKREQKNGLEQHPRLTRCWCCPGQRRAHLRSGCGITSTRSASSTEPPVHPVCTQYAPAAPRCTPGAVVPPAAPRCTPGAVVPSPPPRGASLPGADSISRRAPRRAAPPGHRPLPSLPPRRPGPGPGPAAAAAAMSEPLGWCVEAVRAAAEPGLARALLALRTRHTRRPGGAARFRERGGLGPLLELLGPERPRRTLDLALSVLGNCCTEPGCRRQARRLGGVPRLVALLSSPGPESVQNRVARTLANLALEPDGARDVLDAGAGPLLVSLAASCGTPECLHSAARALRILGAAPAPRRALGQAGAVRALASRLASLSPAHPACPAVARALRGLTDSPGPSADDVAPALPALAALAAHAKRDHRQPALGAIANACARAPLRPALGAAGAVEAVTEEVRRALASPNVAGATVAVRALCLLCREAVNRARVRAAGGLGLLLRLLAEPRARPWRPRVLLALAAFAYDQEALAALEARGLVPLLADVLRARADEAEEEEEEEDEEEDEEEEDEAAASCDLPGSCLVRLGLGQLPGACGDSSEGLLRNLVAAAAAPFGVGLLTHMLRCGAPPARLACATALPLLARPASPARGLLWGGGAVALLLSAVARGPVSPYEPPPAFALYAADAIALLRGHAGDMPGDTPGDGEDALGHASAADLQVHGDGDTKDPWGHGDAEDLWGQADRHGDRGDVPGENGDLQRPSDRHKDLWGHTDTFGDTEDTWRHMDGHAASPADGHGDVGDIPPCTDGHGDPWGHTDGLGDADESWASTGSPYPLSPVALYPPPLLSPVSPCPQISPDPFSLGPPGPQMSPRAAKRPRASSCPQLSPNPPNLHSEVVPRPLKCPLLSSSPLSSNLPNSCPQVSRRSCNPCSHLCPCPQVSPTPLNPCPPPLPCPQVSLASSNPSPQPSPCPQASPSSSNPSPCPRASPGSSNPCPQASPSSSNPSPPPSPAPRASLTPPATHPAASLEPCPYALTPHDLLLLPNGTHPGVPVARAALTQGSPVLGAMLGGAFAEARQAAVALGCAPRRPLLLLLHFVHGCRGRPRDGCPVLSPPVSPTAAGAAIALARRYLVDGFEDVMAAAVSASPGALWALAERWGCAPLAARAAQAILGGPPHNVAPRLVRVARLARCPPRLARALMAAVAPQGAQPHLDMGEPWDGGDPLLRPPGGINGDLGDAQGDLEGLEDDFGIPYEDLGDTQGDFNNMADPFGDPSMDVGDPLGEDNVGMEVKEPL